MNNLLVVLLLAAVHPAVSVRLAAPVDQAALTREYNEISSKLAPSAKLKLHNIATSLRNSAITDGTSNAAIVSAFSGANLSQGDVDQLQLIVLKDAADSAAADLRVIAGEIQNINQQKASLRAVLSKAGKLNAAPHIVKTQLRTAGGTYFRAPAPLPANADAAAMLARLDQLDEMGNANQVMLQTTQSDYTNMLNMISSVLRMISDTNKSIIQNIR